MNYPYENLENFTLPSLLNRSVKLYGERPSFANVGETPITYNAFMQKVQDIIKLLQDSGISKGDKVLLLSENTPNWSVAYFAITYFGAIVVPILVDFHVSEVHHIIRHSEAKAVFVSNKHLQTIEESDKTSVEFVINLDNLEIISELTNQDYISKIKQKTKEVTQKFSKNIEVLEDDLATIIYTSGTTGHSKGVMLSHKNLVTNAMCAYEKVTITTDDVFLSILPLAHTLEATVGMTIPLLHGASVYYINKTPTPNVLIKAFSIVKPTMMISVPLIIEKIYKNKILPKFTDSFILNSLYNISFFRKILNKAAGKKLLETFGGRLRFFGIGGAGISKYVEEFLIEAKFPYIVGYGLTETAPLLAGSVLGAKAKLGSTGSSMVGVELKIKDPNPETGEGEIIAYSPSTMIGYYKEPNLTAEVMDDEWFLTGDLGHIDEDGFLFISGRSKNVIIGASGENIYPEQIESLINKNPVVIESLVMQQDSKLVAKIHLDYEQLDKMFKANSKPDSKVADDIKNYLEKMRLDINSQVSSFSRMQKFIEQIEPFVKTPTKKIKRFLYVD